MLLNRAFALQLGSVHRTAMSYTSPLVFFTVSLAPKSIWICIPWLINLIFWLRYMHYMCPGFPSPHHSITATPVSLDCCLRLLEFFSSHVLNHYFWDAAVFGIYCAIWWPNFKNKRHLCHSPDIKGLLQKLQFLKMETWVKAMEMPYVIGIINRKKLLGPKTKKDFLKKCSELDSTHCTHCCHGNLWPEDINSFGLEHRVWVTLWVSSIWSLLCESLEQHFFQLLEPTVLTLQLLKTNIFFTQQWNKSNLCWNCIPATCPFSSHWTTLILGYWSFYPFF